MTVSVSLDLEAGVSFDNLILSIECWHIFYTTIVAETFIWTWTPMSSQQITPYVVDQLSSRGRTDRVV